MTITSYMQFYNMVLNHGYDIDSHYGWQCWDGYAEYCIQLGVPFASCTVTRYVRDIWEQRKTNGILNYFNEVTQLQPGDVVVFRPCAVTPTSHIAIFHSDCGGGYGYFLGQNQGSPYTNPNGGSAFNLCKLPYSATYDTGFRPKRFGGTSQSSQNGYSEKQLINETATVTLTQAVNKRRDSPTGIVVETLPKGKQLKYTQKWVGNGHRYVSWVEKEPNGNQYRYFVAISGSEKQGQDLWVTFNEQPKESKLQNEHGWAKFKVDQVQIRKDRPNGKVVGSINSGDIVEYTEKQVTDKHRYISYAKDGSRYFIACSPTAERSTEWCDFYSNKPDTVKKNPEQPAKPTNVYTGNVKHWGIDLSVHNENVNMSKYDFVIIQACYGENTDKKFEKFVKMAEEAKIPYGLYLYDYALDDDQAHAETKYLLDLAKSCNPTLGLWIDLENDKYKKSHNSWTKERSSATARIFLDDLKDSGYYTGIYTSSWFKENWFPDFTCDFWIAQYDDNDGVYNSDTSKLGTIHQYSSIDKDTGNGLDKNAMYVDFDHYIIQSQNETKTPKDDKPKSNDDESKSNNDEKNQNEITLPKVNVIKYILSTVAKWFISLFKKKEGTK